jgi:hypothetical protein
MNTGQGQYRTSVSKDSETENCKRKDLEEGFLEPWYLWEEESLD